MNSSLMELIDLDGDWNKILKKFNLDDDIFFGSGYYRLYDGQDRKADS